MSGYFEMAGKIEIRQIGNQMLLLFPFDNMPGCGGYEYIQTSHRFYSLEEQHIVTWLPVRKREWESRAHVAILRSPKHRLGKLLQAIE